MFLMTYPKKKKKNGDLDHIPGHIRCCSISRAWKRNSSSGSWVAQEVDLLGLLKRSISPGFLPASDGGTNSLLLPDLFKKIVLSCKSH